MQTGGGASSRVESTEFTGERRSGRPATAKLSSEKIAQAALAIIDQAGWDALTMKRLAHDLGVRAPSLYHHITGQEQIVHLVRKIIVAEIHDPTLEKLPWDEALIAFGMSYYRAFAKHPNTIQVLSVTPIDDPDTFRMYETFLTVMSQGGWDEETCMDLLLGVEHLALGFAYERNATDLMFHPDKALAHGAPRLAGYVRQRLNQQEVVESSYASLLRRFITMFRSEAPQGAPQKSTNPPEAPEPRGD